MAGRGGAQGRQQAEEELRGDIRQRRSSGATSGRGGAQGRHQAAEEHRGVIRQWRSSGVSPGRGGAQGRPQGDQEELRDGFKSRYRRLPVVSPRIKESSEFVTR